ncbi:hypothetical protein X759_20785 [Mesorhizobium sp. LSHC420B00]|nr:hypothetical protein X759_20785 [Mesorhizobium sp. LSHC420B00]
MTGLSQLDRQVVPNTVDDIRHLPNAIVGAGRSFSQEMSGKRYPVRAT